MPMHMLENGDLDTLNVHSIDRLGRNTLDILNTIQELTNLGVNVVSEKELTLSIKSQFHSLLNSFIY